MINRDAGESSVALQARPRRVIDRVRAGLHGIKLQVINKVLVVGQEDVEVVVCKCSVFLYAGNNSI